MLQTLIIGSVFFVLVVGGFIAYCEISERRTNAITDKDIRRVEISAVNDVEQRIPAGTFTKAMIAQYLAGDIGVLHVALTTELKTITDVTFRIVYNSGTVRFEKVREGSHRFKQLIQRVA